MTTATLPPITYDDCRTPADVNARYRELHAAYDLGTFPLGDTFWAVSEGARRAFERMPADPHRTGANPAATPRVRSGLDAAPARPTEHDDGTLTITCAGPCGETKSVKKFPTTRTGARLNVCRSCRDDAYAKARS